MTTATQAATDRSQSELVRLLEGVRLPATKVGPLYRLGLLVVAATMILLPLIYCGLIVLAGYGLYYHAGADLWLLSGSADWRFKIIAYVGPLAAGMTMIFFMVKPLLAQPAKQPEKISLKPEEEPVLFSFVERLAAAAGAPKPSRIDVDCDVNASASFRKGLLSFLRDDLVLTIGLPLVAGMNVSQVAGILAHEFGHFGQGAGMRVTYVIRTINYWFFRVVYERDEWDESLANASRNYRHWLFAILLGMCRAAVWFSRKILQGLMKAGHAVSCFMMRQMEYDADTYEMKLSGAAGFVSTAMRLQELIASARIANAGLQKGWADRHLPDSLPLYIAGHEIPADSIPKLHEACRDSKTGVFDTHPSCGDRIRAAERAGDPGMLHDESPARNLFRDFESLSRTATEHYYRAECGLKLEQDNLVGTSDFMARGSKETDRQSLLREFFQDSAHVLRPFVLRPDQIAGADPAEDLVTRLGAARERMRRNYPGVKQISEKYGAAEARSTNACCARWLIRAAIRIEAGSFGLSDPTEEMARSTEETADRERQECNQSLAGFDADAADRMTAALSLYRGASCKSIAASAPWQEVEQLMSTLPAFQEILVPHSKLRKEYAVFDYLLRNAQGAPERVGKRIQEIADGLDAYIGEIQRSLAKYPYLLPHAGGPMTLAQYCRTGLSAAGNPVGGIYYDAANHVEKLADVYERTLARLVEFVDQVESECLGPEESQD